MFNRLRQAFQRQDWLAYLIELLLIVLGITIAYQLNVYAQENATQEFKRRLLENLRAENQQNQQELEDEAKHFDVLPDRLKQLQHWITQKKSPLDSVSEELYLVYSWTYYTLNNGYLAHYANSNVRTNNNALENELLRLQYTYQNLAQIADLAKTYRIEEINAYLVDRIDYSSGELTASEMQTLQTPPFINRLVLLTSMEQEHRRLYQEAMQQVNEVDSLLSVELGQ